MGLTWGAGWEVVRSANLTSSDRATSPSDLFEFPTQFPFTLSRLQDVGTFQIFPKWVEKPNGKGRSKD